MLYVPAYTYGRRPYSATLCPTSFTLDSLFVLTICTQRKSHSLCSAPGPMTCEGFFVRLYILWDERGGGLNGQSVGPQVVSATITIVLRTNCVESGSLSSRCCALRRTHTSLDPIRLLCIQLPLPLTLSLPPQFVPSARLMACVSPRALWLVGDFFVTLCLGTMWEEDLLLICNR